MCLFYFFKRILSICSRCCEDNSETGKFMFKHNQCAAVKLRLIHYQQSRKLNNLIPFSFLTTLPHICICGTRKYREIIQISDFNPLLFPEKCTLIDRKRRTKQINIQRAEWMLPKHMACPTSLQPPEGSQLSVGACAPAHCHQQPACCSSSHCWVHGDKLNEVTAETRLVSDILWPCGKLNTSSGEHSWRVTVQTELEL